MTIFEKIIAGDIPSYKIYEDKHVFAFLDGRPHRLWHTLIVPKIAVGDYRDVPEPYFSACFQAAKTLGTAVQKATWCKRPWLLVHGLGVPEHFHLHVIPIHKAEDLDQSKAHEESKEEMQKIQTKIQSNLPKK